MKDEKGQALAISLVALAAVVVLAIPFMRSVNTANIAFRSYEASVAQQYSADAGVEDAIWNLTKGTFAAQLVNPGDTASYSLSQPANGIIPSVAITKVDTAVASDDFESGNWYGGSGWLNYWYNKSAAVAYTDEPYEGHFHLKFENRQGYVERAANLLGRTHLRLQLWARANDFAPDSSMRLLVSPDGTHWTTVKTWTIADSDGTYHFADIDLSPYTMSSNFRVAIDSHLIHGYDKFYADDLRIVGPGAAYEIISSAGNEQASAYITIYNGNVYIRSWNFERQ